MVGFFIAYKKCSPQELAMRLLKCGRQLVINDRVKVYGGKHDGQLMAVEGGRNIISAKTRIIDGESYDYIILQEKLNDTNHSKILYYALVHKSADKKSEIYADFKRGLHEIKNNMDIFSFLSEEVGTHEFNVD